MCVLVGSDFTPPGTLSDEYAFPFLGVQGTSAPGVQDLVLAFGVADRAAGGLLPQSRELLGLVPLLPPPDRALPPAFEATPVFVPLLLSGAVLLASLAELHSLLVEPLLQRGVALPLLAEHGHEEAAVDQHVLLVGVEGARHPQHLAGRERGGHGV